MRRIARLLGLSCTLALALAAPAWGVHDTNFKDRMNLVFGSPTGAINSDLAFWGDRAYAGNYNGFRIFDISDPDDPKLVTDFPCYGPQNDLSVWDTDGDDKADLLIASVDRTLAGSACGSPAVAHDDPSGWEGLRLFDISNEGAPVQIGAVYQDCGSHTHTVIPKEDRLLLLNSSYPLRPGPTCGPVNGPAVGRDALHGVIQVVEVPLGNPAAAAEIAELPIVYPGDADNKFTPSERGLSAPGVLIDGMRACHDMTVFVELGLVAAACAEQLQLWRLGADGLPDTSNPLWVYDQPNVDFWHSATFSWDGKVVNGIDESFGSGCPTTTTLPSGDVVDSGNMFFLSTASGGKLSEFRMPRRDPDDHVAQYCSAHLGLSVPMPGRNLLVDAWYTAGVDVIDYTNPRSPREIAYYDVDGDNWSAYPYEHGTPKPNSPLRIYASDGVEDPPTGDGFQALTASIPGRRIGLGHLNPQTQERVIKSASADTRGTPTGRRSATLGAGGAKSMSGARQATRHLAP
ncbi:hypothetical protein BH20ACT16_BH20ACT16_00590 [soil metagenome]